MKEQIFSLKIKIIVFFINIFTLIIIGFFQFKYQHDAIKEEFNYNIEYIIKKEFSNIISTTNGVITSFVSYFQSSPNMNTSSYSRYSKDLIANYDFMNSVAYASLVQHHEKTEFEQMMKDNGLFNFQIKSYDKEKEEFVKSKTHEVYAPIIYIEPSSFNYTRYYGFDFYNNEVSQKSLDKASQENSIEILDGVFNEKNELLNLFIKPTYSEDISNDDRLSSLNGFFVIDIDTSKVLTRLKNRFDEYNIKIVNKETYNSHVKQAFLTQKSLFNELKFLSKIDDFNNSYLVITKQISFKDINFKIFFMIMFLVVIIQILYVLVWQKDRFAKNRLNYKASHDDLTGLTNRAFFKKTFVNKIKTSDEKNPAAILFIDLDRFKEINDSFGHKFGDEVLVEVANRFRLHMRSNDTICRYGGDEFIILVDQLKELSDVIEVIKKITKSMNTPFIYHNQKIYLTLSIGISMYPGDGETVDDLLKNADSALYKAKDEGRNTYRFYTEDMTLEVMQKILIENKLRDAITNDDFIVYYQPQYDARSDKLIGMEALVRWQDKDEGLISPGKFIPIAEETGLIVKLDQLVMKKAIRDFSTWMKKGLNPGSLSLNLSMLQLKDSHFISKLKDTLKSNDCSTSNIELEVTEGQIMQNPLEAIEKLKELSSYGIKLSVDDFGTGYSSLAYLKKLPINKLKIDRAFVKDLPDNEEDIAISKSVIALAHNLKLDVIAEGVETLEQKNFLVKNGCFKIQGFYYSKPICAEDLEKLLIKIKS